MSLKSPPASAMNGTPASPATARASSVLPAPEWPSSTMPLGGFAPSSENFPGLLEIGDDVLERVLGLLDADHVVEARVGSARAVLKMPLRNGFITRIR